MGKRVSHIYSKSNDFYLVNIPYLDYFIVQTLYENETNKITLLEIKHAYERKHKKQAHPTLYSHALTRLESRGIIRKERTETVLISFSSGYVRSQLSRVFHELKIFQTILEKKQSENHNGHDREDHHE